MIPLETVMVGNSWVFDGSNITFNEDEKDRIDHAWERLVEINKDGALKKMSYHLVVVPVATDTVDTFTRYDENSDKFQAVVDELADCIFEGRVLTWTHLSQRTAYTCHNRGKIFDTKAEAIKDFLFGSDVTPELLIEAVELLRDESR